MSRKHRDLLEDVLAGLLSLSTCRGNADDDVPQDFVREAAEVTFAHRERQDVGRAIFSAIDFVQLMNSIIVS